MGYRDQRSALEGKVEVLQEKLDESQRALEEHRGSPDIAARTDEIEREIAAARSRIDALGVELAALRGPARPPPARRGLLVTMVIACLGLLAGIAAAVFLLRRPATTGVGEGVAHPPVHVVPAPAPVPVPSGRRQPSGIYVGERLCFLGAGADGVPDIGGLVRFYGDSDFHLAVFDGHTGRRRWASEHVFKASWGYPPAIFHCRPKEGALFVWGADRSLFLHDVKTGAERWSAHTDDKPRQASFGAGCVKVELVDNSAVSFDLATGARAACAPPRLAADERPADDPGPALIKLDGSTVTLTAKPSGTPTLIVRSTGKHTWERKLPLTALGTNQRLRLQAREDAIVVAGADPVEEDTVSLVGLDPATGEVRYTRPFPRVNNEWVPVFRLEGPYLYAVLGDLRAYDPATGEEVWQVGQ